MGNSCNAMDIFLLQYVDAAVPEMCVTKIKRPVKVTCDGSSCYSDNPPESSDELTLNQQLSHTALQLIRPKK